MEHISIDELKKMTEKEGLVLQGCGGDLQEWVDGINDMLTAENILCDGDKFNNVMAFENNGVTNLLFIMDNVKFDAGEIAMWRLKTHEQFGGTWLSDYLPNQLNIEWGSKPQKIKPDCPIIGAEGNIFNIMAIASRTLKENGMKEDALQMRERVRISGSYDEALAIITEYVNPVDTDDITRDFEMEGM